MEKPKVDAEQQIDFGTNETEGLMLASDQNIVDIRFTVLWRIADPEDYLFNVQAQEAVVKAVAESAMREVVGRTPAENIRTTGRQSAQDQVKQIVQATLDQYQAGIIITAVNLLKADPPAQVIAAFEEVQRAEQNQAQFINEAELYANQRAQLAQGESAKLVEEARAYKSRVVAEAEGEAQRFLSVYNEYKNAKDVTRQRMFLEMMEQVLGRSNKIIVEESGGQGVVPYLPLPEVQKRVEENAAATGGQQ
jgi:membrane protease subunit HflK